MALIRHFLLVLHDCMNADLIRVQNVYHLFYFNLLSEGQPGREVKISVRYKR